MKPLSAGFYARLETLSARLADGLAEGAAAAGAPVTFHRVGSMQCAFFTAGPVSDWKSASASDTHAFAAFFRALLERGIYVMSTSIPRRLISGPPQRRSR